MRFTEAVVIVTLFIKCICCKNFTNSTFVATSEWQEIPPDSAIPAGLHVRINLQTGKREAKLLSQSDEGNSNSVVVQNTDETLNIKGNNADKKKTLLSDALKSVQKERLRLKFSAEKLSQIKREYKAKQNIPDSKADKFERFQLDAEIIANLVADFLDLTNLESKNEINAADCLQRKLHVLDNFENMLHQIDNSIQFVVSHKGLDLLLPIVANESLPLRLRAIRVLGVVTQNNPQVQKEVLTRSFGTHLLKIMMSSMNSEELAATVFAFGSLVRKFPQAQKIYLSHSGAQTLISILIKAECELRVKIKIMNLFSDLLEEHKEIKFMSNQHAETSDFEYYKNSELEDWLHAEGYCEAVASVVVFHVLEFLKQPDLLDDYVMALDTSRRTCQDIWKKIPKLKVALMTLKDNYILEEDEYYREVSDKVIKEITLINVSTHKEL